MEKICRPAMPENFIASIADENICLQLNRQLQHIPSAFSIQTKNFSFQIQLLHFTFNREKKETGFHQHRFIELTFPLRDMYYCIGEKGWKTEADSGILLIPPGEEHSRTALRENALCFAVIFDLQTDCPELTADFFRAVRQKKFRIGISDSMNKIIYDICQRFNDDADEFSGNVHYLLFNQLIIELMRHNFPSFFTHSPGALSTNSAEKIRVYLTHNLQSSDTLDELSRRMKLSKRHLNRLFASVYGLSIKQWIIRERIRQAAQMLLTTDESVKVIADNCGFNNMSYFSRLFCRFYNMTPAHYRRKG